MLPAGQVDAAWLPQPLGEIAEQQYGALPIADFDQGSLQDFPFTGYMGTTQWVKRTRTRWPPSCGRWTRASSSPTPTARRWRAAMEKYTGITPIIADTMAIDTYPLEMDVPQLQRVADSMYEFGLTGRSPVPDRQHDPAGARPHPQVGDCPRSGRAVASGAGTCPKLARLRARTPVVRFFVILQPGYRCWFILPGHG